MVDKISRGLSIDDDLDFRHRCLRSMKTCNHSDGVYNRFFVWMLTDNEYGMINHANTGDAKTIQDIADMLGNNFRVSALREKDFETIMQAGTVCGNAYIAATPQLKESYLATANYLCLYSAVASAFGYVDQSIDYATTAAACYAAEPTTCYAAALTAWEDAIKALYKAMAHKLLELLAA